MESDSLLRADPSMGDRLEGRIEFSNGRKASEQTSAGGFLRPASPWVRPASRLFRFTHSFVNQGSVMDETSSFSFTIGWSLKLIWICVVSETLVG